MLSALHRPVAGAAVCIREAPLVAAAPDAVRAERSGRGGSGAPAWCATTAATVGVAHVTIDASG